MQTKWVLTPSLVGRSREDRFETIKELPLLGRKAKTLLSDNEEDGQDHNVHYRFSFDQPSEDSIIIEREVDKTIYGSSDSESNSDSESSEED